MFDDEVEYLRKMLLDIDMDIARIEKNHHIETEKERKEADEQLAFLYERRAGVKNSIAQAMIRNMESSNYGGRGSFGGKGI